MNRKLLFILLLVIGVNAFSFAQPSDFSSNLPLFYINTNGDEIRDEPKIEVELGIIWNENGGLNQTSGSFNHFSGNIGIEIRGSSSQSFPKKSYGFELHNDSGEDIDFPLLGLPEEEDWILYAPYSDKSLIRNVLTFTIAEKLGNYTPRCRFVELFINSEYQGVYVLMEKIKRDKNRVDIAKLKPEDLAGEDLTGGYIVKIDKTTGSSGSGWHSKFENNMQKHTFYQYEYPDYDEIASKQADYIKNYIDNFETALYNKEFDPENGYQKYIDINTFIDYFIINEVAKNVDGYRLSTFMYKDKNEKLNLGPIWDFNLAFGNANYYNAWETFGLQVNADLAGDEWQNPFWWKKFLSDKNFTQELRCRWDELHAGVLAPEQIVATVDSLVNLLQEPAKRNFQKWPVLGVYVWPNQYVSQTYSNEINWLKNWIYERMRSLHLAIPGKCEPDEMQPQDFMFSIFPNPFQTKLTMSVITDTSFQMQIELFSANGAKVYISKETLAEGLNTIELNLPQLRSGVYIYRITKGDVEIEVGKLVKL